MLLVASASTFMVFLDATIVNISFPSFEVSFPEASRPGLSWVLSAYSIVFTALLVPAGRMADARGRRRWFIGGLALFTLASAACAAAPTAELLIAARVLQAAGGAVIIPTGLAFVLAECPPERRAQAVSLYGAVAAIAAAIGPPLGGVIVDGVSWRWVFLLNLPIGIAALIGAVRLLPDERGTDRRLPDLLGVVILTAGVALLALGIVQGEPWGWGDDRIVGAFAASAVLLPFFFLRSRRHPRPVVELSLFRIRSFAVANAGTLLLGIVFYGTLLANVLFLIGVWGYSALEAGLALVPAPVVAALAAGPAGALADRFGHRRVIVPGALIVAAANALLWARLGNTPDFVGVWLPANALLGLGMGIAYSVVVSAALVHVPHERYALASGVNTIGRQLGSVLSVALVVAIVGTPGPPDPAGAFDEAWALVVVLAVAAAAVCLLFPDTARATRARAEALAT